MSTDISEERILEDDPVALILGSDAAALRHHILSDLVPQLDSLTAGRSEDDELSDELFGALADDPHDLLQPPADSGDDLGIRVATVATEALSTARQTYMVPVLVSALARTPVVLAGSAEQRARYLDRVGDGRRISFAMSEPDAGSDVGAIETVAARDGDGFVLNGLKRWVTVTGDLDWLVVFAKPDDAERPGAFSCFVVDAAARGLTIKAPADLLGMRAVPLCDVELADVRVPADALLGEHGRGFGLALRSLNAVRPVVGARGTGLAAAAIMHATRYVEQRRAQGGTLADLQLVRTKLGGLAARLEAARLLVYRAAALVDRGGIGKEAGPVLAAAKLVGTELAVEAATTCMHLAGAAGYTESLPFARLLRDAQQLTIVEGVSEVQLELVARGLLDRALWWEASG